MPKRHQNLLQLISLLIANAVYEHIFYSDIFSALFYWFVSKADDYNKALHKIKSYAIHLNRDKMF